MNGTEGDTMNWTYTTDDHLTGAQLEYEEWVTAQEAGPAVPYTARNTRRTPAPKPYVAPKQTPSAYVEGDEVTVNSLTLKITEARFLDTTLSWIYAVDGPYGVQYIREADLNGKA